MNVPSADWVRTDAGTDTVEGLRLLLDLLGRARSDPYAWVWVLIVLHRTVQASLLECLGTASLLGRVDEETAQQVYESIHGRADRPSVRMLSSKRLYKRAKERNEWSVDRSVEEDLALLAGLRDSFLHPLSSSHSIEVALLPTVVDSSFSIIGLCLSSCSGWQTNGCREEAEQLLKQCRQWGKK